MIYAVIAAGGIGSRMGNLEKPKQYLTLKDKPIIVHTVEKFYVNSAFKKVIILCPDQWVSYTKNILAKHLPENERVLVLKGGSTRNETIMNAVKYIEETDGLDEETVIVTHDAVRPFVSARIIDENIDAALESAQRIPLFRQRTPLLKALTKKQSAPFPTEAASIKVRLRRHSKQKSSRSFMKVLLRTKKTFSPTPAKFSA